MNTTTHPQQQDCPKIPHTESNHKNKTNDENPVGNFITWLTTTTPTTPVLEIDVVGEKERMETILCKETTEKQESLLLSTPPREQQPSSPSRSPLILSLTRRRKKEQQQVHKPKEFGELVSIHIPDLERTIQNRVFELAEQQHNSSNNNNDDDDDARPHLPSHVPTPDTLHTNEDHSTSIGLHHHLQTMIFHNKNNNNNDAGDHTNYHKGMEIKYAPSPITPPQSPARTSKNKTLAMPLAATKSKWGPDFWNSKKKSLLTSTSSSMCMDVSCSSLVADDSSDFDDSSTTSLSKSKTKAKTKTKRPSSPSSVMDCDITNTAAVTTTPPPLQLQWMHENALNLQSMRDSIRYCGDYDEVDDDEDEAVSSMGVVHAQHHYRYEELECSMLLPRTPSLLELATMDEQ